MVLDGMDCFFEPQITELRRCFFGGFAQVDRICLSRDCVDLDPHASDSDAAVG